MPKVLRIINRFNLGGPTFNAAYLSKYMSPEFETLLVGGQKDPSEAGSEFIAEELGLEPIVLGKMKRSINMQNDYAVYRELRKIIREFKPDIVHTHASKAGAVGRFAAIHEKVPIIVHTFHGNVFKGYFGSFKTGIYKSLERYLAKRTSAVIAISELQKTELVTEHLIAPAEKIHIIPLGFDLSRFHENLEEKRKIFRERWKIGNDEILFGIVGRLVPVKNHKLFLDALNIFLKKHPGLKWKAVIVGDGEMRAELGNYADSLGLDAGAEAGRQVIFTSWIREVDEVNAGIDIAVLSSLNEGTPVSLIEAQAAGCPVVTTDVGGIRNITIPGETALLSPSGDAGKLAENLFRLASDSGLRKKFTEKGWPFVKERFHYTRLVSDMSALYNQLLQSNAKR
jgi:glycosyltransferase involved in cell wall biosynthesis